MAIFKYIATDYMGLKKSGSVDARSQDVAVSLLKNQGLVVISIQEKTPTLFDELLNFRGIPENDVVIFTRQFATMISSGLPLSRALEILVEQTPSRSFKRVLLDILRDVEGGIALSASMGRFPGVFSPTYQALVRAGESTGKLDQILERLAKNMEAQRALRGKFKSAMVYPIIVFLAMIGVFMLMMIFVIPQLADMYKSLNVELPWMTKLMINISAFFVTYKWIVFMAFIGFAIGIRTFLQTDTGKNILASLSFAIPVFGRINTQKELAEFTNTLSLLIASAIPIVEALKIVSKVVRNKAYYEAALEATRRVEKGTSLSECFKQNNVFPPILPSMIAVGEETGQLDVSLDRVSKYFAEEVEHAVAGLTAALEPIILLLLGGMVGILIISIIVPIYKITSSL